MEGNNTVLVSQIFSSLGIPTHARGLFRGISRITPSEIYSIYPEAYQPYDLAGLKYSPMDENYDFKNKKGLYFWPFGNTDKVKDLVHLTVFETTSPHIPYTFIPKAISTCSEWGTNILKSMKFKCKIGNPIHAGVNTDIFNDKDRNYENAPHKFLIVAKHEERKGIEVALKAFHIVSMGYTNITLTALITDPFDSNFNIINYLKSSGIPSSGKIHLIRPPESPKEMADLYRDHHVLLFPSRGEAIGLPIIEAMATGCVPIVTNTSAIPEYVGNAGLYIDVEKMEDVFDQKWFPIKGKFGQWAKPSLDSLVANMIQLLENDALWLMKSGQSSARISKLFTWQNAAKEALKEINS